MERAGFRANIYGDRVLIKITDATSVIARVTLSKVGFLLYNILLSY
jgi:hypothetical protein